jgi:hypothetical protein
MHAPTDIDPIDTRDTDVRYRGHPCGPDELRPQSYLQTRTISSAMSPSVASSTKKSPVF